MFFFAKHARPASYLTRAALIAALYVLLTVLLRPLSFSAVQCRVSEALMLLPIVLPEATAGLFAGCLLANLLGGALWYDVLLGSLATLLAALAVRGLRKRPLLAAAAPALINAVIVGPVVYFAYVEDTGVVVLLLSVLSVALGELLACYILGLPLLRFLKRIPALHEQR